MSSYKYDVSIIIPFYQRQAEVEKLLTSLNNMDVEEVQLETIVVEDGSRVENSDQLKSLCNNINSSFHYNKKKFRSRFMPKFRGFDVPRKISLVHRFRYGYRQFKTDEKSATNLTCYKWSKCSCDC